MRKAIFAAVKKLISGILLLLMAFQTMYPAVFTAWFYANQQAIAARHCVNKKRPQLNCDGKCYLAKKIQAAEEQQAGTEPSGIRNVWVESSACILQEYHPLHPAFALAPQVFSNYRVQSAQQGFSTGIFRPPAMS